MMLACMNSCLDFKNITKRKSEVIQLYQLADMMCYNYWQTNTLSKYIVFVHFLHPCLYFVSLFLADYHSLSLQDAELQNNANLN